jgi:hypothetical protein
MGAAQSKARQPPARYVAKQLARAPKEIETEFKKAKHTIQGINKMTERVTTTPQPYVEKAHSADATQQQDTSAPRWYLNSWMELMDNRRQDRLIITGNLPASWERDRFEPYTLVRNRIDDEDLDWLLSAGKQLPMDDLVHQTKLERQTLEDILATVELPRRQYRNYQGKLHKAIDDPNTYLADRKARMEESREDELLRQIGYTDEELKDDKQYRTTRSRGVKTLDELGVSVRANKRLERVTLHDDMTNLLEQRKIAELEAGTYEPSDEELRRPEEVGVPRGQLFKARTNQVKELYKMDRKTAGTEDKLRKIAWWTDRRKDIVKSPDHFPDAPVYNERLSASETEAKSQLDRSALLSQQLAMAQGAKGYFDPRSQYQEMLEIMRAQKTLTDEEGNPREWEPKDHPTVQWMNKNNPQMKPKLGKDAEDYDKEDNDRHKKK